MRFPGLSTPLAYPLLGGIAMIDQLFSGANYQATKQLLDVAVPEIEREDARFVSTERRDE